MFHEEVNRDEITKLFGYPIILDLINSESLFSQWKINENEFGWVRRG